MSEEYEPGLVSVIIPTYNRAGFLVEAMDSVWAQTYRPIELIVVDDGSTDNTKQVVEEWSKKCANDDQFELRYFYQENKGAPVARNLGLIESRGEYILMHDSDDVLGTQRIALHVRRLLRTSTDMCFASWSMFPHRGEGYVCPTCSQDPMLDFLEGRLHGGTQSWLAKRHLWRQARGFDESLVCYQDIDLTFRLLTLSPKVSFEPRALTYVGKDAPSRVCARKTRPEGLRSIYRSHAARVRFLQRLPDANRYLRAEANEILKYAVMAQSVSALRIMDDLTELIRQTGEEPEWGGSLLKRALYRIGGVRLCGTLMRLFGRKQARKYDG